jgi:hypothetical protein
MLKKREPDGSHFFWFKCPALSRLSYYSKCGTSGTVEDTICHKNKPLFIHAYFTTFFKPTAISGRKNAFYYACIKSIPNTVLNFGIVH